MYGRYIDNSSNFVVDIIVAIAGGAILLAIISAVVLIYTFFKERSKKV